MYLANAAQIRRADQVMIKEQAFPGILLMETAGRKSAEFILATYPNKQFFLILAGPGNNGGDGLVIARYLQQAGKTVRVLLSHSPDVYQGDALLAWKALNKDAVAVKQWPEGKEWTAEGRVNARHLRVDALLGTGVKSAPRGVIAEILETHFLDFIPTVAIDMPSGLSADSGRLLTDKVLSPVEYTLTFQLPKVCHYVFPAASYCGKVVTVDIGIRPDVLMGLGIGRSLLCASKMDGFAGERSREGHKGTFGHALLVGGCARYAGAIALSGFAALRGGAGLSTVFGPERVAKVAAAMGPECMHFLQPGDALDGAAAKKLLELLTESTGMTLGIGPGLGQGKPQYEFLSALLPALSQRVVLDADALNLLAAHPDLWEHVPPESILTPHPGEMRRLMGLKRAPGMRVLEERLEVAEELAVQRNCVVVLKGAGSIVAKPDGSTYVNTTGNAGMATGGSGDVLTGLITGLLAQGMEVGGAAALGVYLHGLAGDLAAEQSGQEAVIASDILNCIGPALKALRTQTAPKLLQL